MAIRSLKADCWPEADRLMWARLIRQGRLLDEAGPGAGWALETKRVYARDYGYWLSFLSATAPRALDDPPVERVTRSRIRAYCQSMAGRALITLAGRIARLNSLLALAHPDRDLTWLAESRRALERAARQAGRARRKQGRVMHTGKLYEAGLRLMAKGNSPIRPVQRTTAFQLRDGLMIALLAARPLRLKNFASLRIGCHIREAASGYLLDIPGHETKTGQPIECFVPVELVPWVKSYIEVFRPNLLCGSHSDFLWVNNAGRPYAPGALSQRIAKLTQRLVGVSISPHLFRDCAATTIAIDDPEHVMITAALLGHSSLKTAEDHYNQARCMEASRRYQLSIENLRRQARAAVRRRRLGRVT